MFAVDIDFNKLLNLCKNAFIYKVLERIKAVQMNCLHIDSVLRFGLAFSSPAWGGVDYDKKEFSLEK